MIVDAAILVAAARGRSSGVVARAAAVLALTTTSRAVEEARRRIELGMLRPDLLPTLDRLVENMTVVPVAALMPWMAAAAEALRNAVASSSGSTNDAHVLALAWEADADIWSTDRDFAGTGVASWSTPNLLRALAAAGT